MDSIEKAIRNAFEKGDPSDRAFREKVYRSAYAALDRALQANPNVTDAIAARRREALSAAITQIESEFLPAVPAVEPVYAPAAAPAPRAADEPRAEPRHAPAGRSEPGFEPVVTQQDRSDHAEPDGYDDGIEPPSYDDFVRHSRRRAWLSPVLALLVLAVVAAGAWWVLASGPVGGSSQPRPPPAAEAQPDRPAEPPRVIAGADDLAGWIVIFDPADPTTVTAPGDSQAEVIEDEGERFIRISSGASGAPVLFDVGQGVLEQVTGRRAVFNVVARAQEGQETQISVECSLGALGDCGRKRYAVGVTREEFLFEMTLPSTNPGAGGTIAINPDIENTGRPVDIYAIRVSPAQ